MLIEAKIEKAHITFDQRGGFSLNFTLIFEDEQYPAKACEWRLGYPKKLNWALCLLGFLSTNLNAEELNGKKLTVELDENQAVTALCYPDENHKIVKI